MYHNPKIFNVDTAKEHIEFSDDELTPHYITIKQVKELTTLSRATVDRLENGGQFPKRIPLSDRKVVWLYTEVLNWCLKVKQVNGYPDKNTYTE